MLPYDVGLCIALFLLLCGSGSGLSQWALHIWIYGLALNLPDAWMDNVPRLLQSLVVPTKRGPCILLSNLSLSLSLSLPFPLPLSFSFFLFLFFLSLFFFQSIFLFILFAVVLLLLVILLSFLLSFFLYLSFLFLSFFPSSCSSYSSSISSVAVVVWSARPGGP